MAFSKLVDLEMDDEQMLDSITPIAMPEKARYPYGLKICLCGSEMKKLSLDPADCRIGDYIDLRAFGEVTSISEDRVEIQIQRMAVENESTEEED